MAINVEVLTQATVIEVVNQPPVVAEIDTVGVQGPPGSAGAAGAALPFPVSASMFNAHTLLTLGLANRCFYIRNIGASATITKVGIHVGTSSGNISIAVYSPTGADPATAVPGTRKVTTGAIACPGTGYQVVTIPSVTINNGDFFALSCDNNTATFAGFASSINSSGIFNGLGAFQESGHPAPVTPGGLDPNLNRAPVMKGLL